MAQPIWTRRDARRSSARAPTASLPGLASQAERAAEWPGSIAFRGCSMPAWSHGSLQSAPASMKTDLRARRLPPIISIDRIPGGDVSQADGGLAPVGRSFTRRASTPRGSMWSTRRHAALTRVLGRGARPCEHPAVLAEGLASAGPSRRRSSA